MSLLSLTSTFFLRPCSAPLSLLDLLPTLQLNRQYHFVVFQAMGAQSANVISTSSLTTQCTNALAGVAASPDAASCLSLGSLLPIATAKNDTSIIAPINAWLTNLCGSPACSNETLAAVVQNITTGCSTELAATGFTADLTSSVTSAVQVYYPTVRKVVCLKEYVSILSPNPGKD